MSLVSSWSTLRAIAVSQRRYPIKHPLDVAKRARSLTTKPSLSNSNQKKQPTEEEQLDEVERLLSSSHAFPTVDIWGQTMNTLDVQIPYSFSWRGASSTTIWERIKANVLDNVKNAVSMHRMAAANAFPHLDLSPSGRIDRFFRWPILAFRCRSIKPVAWIGGLRLEALDMYKALNKAISARDSKTVKRLTMDKYQQSALRLVRKQGGSDVYLWKLHEPIKGDPPPARVLSIRATDGYLGRDEPKVGNRLVVHVLVKFDTKQSLQIYSKQGELLSSQPPKRVIEYLVLEKRMWYSTPWMIREQIYETPGVHV